MKLEERPWESGVYGILEAKKIGHFLLIYLNTGAVSYLVVVLVEWKDAGPRDVITVKNPLSSTTGREREL